MNKKGAGKTLYFLTCGHVDDGKSTLIGRLLYDVGVVPEDQVQGAKVNGKIDYSRLTDGLEDERAQGITIDVAYRFFRYQGRHYRIADTPGHIQYFRNMAAAAVGNDCALILIDAKHGVREQTLRHSRIAAFFGIRHFIIAINKMDLVEYKETRFLEIEQAYRTALGDIKGLSLYFIPVSALGGDNVVTGHAPSMPWYTGPSLLEFLSTVEVPPLQERGVRLPIQSLIRYEGKRGYHGLLTGGELQTGQSAGIAGSEIVVTIAELYHGGQKVERVSSGQAITVVLHEDVDLSRGKVLFDLASPMRYTDAFRARVTWLDPTYTHQEKFQIILKLHTREEQAEIHISSVTGAISTANIYTARALPVDAYTDNPVTGLFLMIQPEMETVIGAGIITAPETEDWNFSI